MILTHIRWKDASYHEATWKQGEGDNAPAVPALSILVEVGFLLAENEEAILLGMEHTEDKDTSPGRWRISIPKSAIIERVDVDVKRAFRVVKPRAKKPVDILRSLKQALVESDLSRAPK